MNERIRELAEEHGFIHEYMSIGERNDALTKYREFAELIVRECAEKFAAEPDKPFYGRHVSYHILEHFGVE